MMSDHVKSECNFVSLLCENAVKWCVDHGVFFMAGKWCRITGGLESMIITLKLKGTKIELIIKVYF